MIITVLKLLLKILPEFPNSYKSRKMSVPSLSPVESCVGEGEIPNHIVVLTIINEQMARALHVSV